MAISSTGVYSRASCLLQIQRLNRICYFNDNYYFFIIRDRYVVLPGDMAKLVPKTHLMTESEWRNLGIRMTPGWVNYMRHHSSMYLPNRLLLFYLNLIIFITKQI